MDKAIEIFTFMAVLSVAVERIVQLLKIFPTFKKWFGNEKVLQLVTAVIGFGIAALLGVKCFTSLIQYDWATYVIVGLLTSAGSGFWHDGLTILKDLKSGTSSTNK